jgi:hypothetical protein
MNIVFLFHSGVPPFLVFDIKPYSSIITRRLMCHENHKPLRQFDAAIPFQTGPAAHAGRISLCGKDSSLV